MKASPERDALIEQIRTAFGGVVLGVGIGLWEGQAIDDRETGEGRARERSRDEKEDWSRIAAVHLNACHSSLSFFDALGMRFHLPAFLIADLQGEYQMGGLAYGLSGTSDWEAARFGLLNREQRRAVRAYLLYVFAYGEDEDYGYIASGLELYWTEESCGL